MITLQCPYFIQKYAAIKLVGSGSFGSVYEAQDIETKKTYAMKIIEKRHLVHRGDIPHLQHEIDSLAFLKSEYIVSLHDFFSNQQYFFLIMDWCPGQSLESYIQRNGPLRETTAATVFQQIVLAVDFCHSHGVAHRDIKPQNILITKFPNIKLSDFGLCGYVVPDTLMKTVCGTPSYTAPEIIKNQEYDGCMADIWSLGVLLYELVTGIHPWSSNNLPQMHRQITNAQYTIPGTVSPACCDLINSLLRPRPLSRPTTSQILKFPWLKLGKTNHSISSMKHNQSNLPSLTPDNMAEFSVLMERNAFKKDCGIVSPFQKIASTTALISHKPTKICVKAESVLKSAPFRSFSKPRKTIQPRSIGSFH